MLRAAYRDHWACHACSNTTPHLHEYGPPGARYWVDHGYTAYGIPEATPRFDREVERVAGYPCMADAIDESEGGWTD